MLLYEDFTCSLLNITRLYKFGQAINGLVNKLIKLLYQYT